MKLDNIIKRLKKEEGYETTQVQYDFWQVVGVELKNGEVFVIAETKEEHGNCYLIVDFPYNDVLDAIIRAERNKEKNPFDRIYSMSDYYNIKERFFKYGY